jgi:hypothetical protein
MACKAVKISLIGILFFWGWVAWAAAAEGQQSGVESETPPEIDQKRHWVGIMGSAGSHYHLWSANTYTGYKTASVGAFYEWESERAKFFSAELGRTWRVELRYAYLWGTVPIDEDQASDDDLLRGPPYSVTLDQHKISLVGVRRWIFLPDYPVRPTTHLGFGMSVVHEPILERGTIWAFDFVGGVGLEADLNERWCLMADVRWEHFSNGGDMGLTNGRVIGPESVNLVLSLRYQY